MRAYAIDAAGNRIVIADGWREAAWSYASLKNALSSLGLDDWEQLAVVAFRRATVWVELWNPDGTPEGFCGNALRSMALIPSIGVHDRIAVHTSAGRFHVLQEAAVEVAAADIRVSILDQDVIVDMGTPHRVRRVRSLAKVEELGLAWSRSGDAINATFVQQAGAILHCRTFERGVGETSSCASGALAAIIAHALHTGEQSATGQQVRFRSGQELTVTATDEAWQISGPCRVIQTLILPGDPASGVVSC